MNLDQKILARFDELIDRGNDVLDTKATEQVPLPVVVGTIGGGVAPAPTYASTTVNAELSIRWGVNCRHLLAQVFTRDSDHYKQFEDHFGDATNPQRVARALAVMIAAKDDYEHGMLFDTRTLIQADVFSDFLEQAEHLLQRGYHGPTAVTVGAVLEDGLRRLCARHNVPVQPDTTLTPMNDALAKAGAYSKLAHDNLIPAIRVRNDAAHGKWDQFTKDDVANMLQQVRSFMTAHFS